MGLLEVMQPGRRYAKGDLALLTKKPISVVDNRLANLLKQRRVEQVKSGTRTLYRKKEGA